MDLQEATLTMAILMDREANYYKQQIENFDPRDGDEEELKKTLIKQHQWLQANVREYGNRLAAHPYFFDVMESWVINISGKEGVNKQSIKDALSRENGIDELLNRASNLASGIKGFLRGEGYIICDMGAGEDGWDISVRCTEKKSRVLCADLHQRWSAAIEAKILAVSRRFAGHALPGLYNHEDALKIIKMYGDTDTETLL